MFNMLFQPHHFICLYSIPIPKLMIQWLYITALTPLRGQMKPTELLLSVPQPQILLSGSKPMLLNSSFAVLMICTPLQMQSVPRLALLPLLLSLMALLVL
nr:MAG TPA: hypothetical protein [Caudoviricetes sp.]